MSVIEIKARPGTGANLFAVEDLQVRFSNATEKTYQRIRMKSPRSVMIVAFTPRNTLLFIREFAAGIGDYVIKFPTGSIMKDESVEAAAVRELQEETGWTAKTVSVVKAIYADPGHCDQKTHVVVARDLVRGEARGDEPESPTLQECPAGDWQSLYASLVDARSAAALASVSGSFEVDMP